MDMTSSTPTQQQQQELPQLRGVFEMKTDALFAKWSSRYFSLEEDKLFFYKSRSHLEHLGCIDLHQILSVKQRAENSRNTRLFVLQIVCLDHETLFIDMVRREKLDRWIIVLSRWIRFFEAKRRDDNDLVRNSIRMHNQRMLSEIDSRPGIGAYSGIKDVLTDGVNSTRNKGGTPSKSSALSPTSSNLAASPSNSSATVELQARVKLLEDLLQQQMSLLKFCFAKIIFIEDMGSKFANEEEKYQVEMEELSAKFETKKKQFETLLERKDQALAHERNLRFQFELQVAQMKEQLQQYQSNNGNGDKLHGGSETKPIQATPRTLLSAEKTEQQQKYFVALGAAYKSLYNKYNSSDDKDNDDNDHHNDSSLSNHNHNNNEVPQTTAQEMKSPLARSYSITIKRSKSLSNLNSNNINRKSTATSNNTPHSDLLLIHHVDDDDEAEEIVAAPSSLPEMDLALLYEAAMASSVPIDKVEGWLEAQLQ